MNARSDAEILAAGAKAAEDFPPLTNTEITTLAQILSPLNEADGWRRIDVAARTGRKAA